MELAEAIDAALADTPARIVVSNPRGASPLRRVTCTRREDGSSFDVEELTATQAFQHRATAPELPAYLLHVMSGGLSQLNTAHHQVRVSKKGKVFLTSTKGSTAALDSAPTGEEDVRPLDRADDLGPLVDMGLLTPEGAVVPSMGDKYRQVNRFVEMLDDGLRSYDRPDIRVIDFGCGKSYLTFVVYHYLTHVRHLQASMVGLDLKTEVIEHCEATARRYGYDGLHFQLGDIAAYDCAEVPDLVISLHACDTATDLALANAIRWGTGLIYSVPCCQHELNAQLHAEHLELIGRYGLVRERMAALMTDAIRADLLEACGYRTQLLEFIEMEHTPKNILIRAQRVQRPPEAAADVARRMRAEVQAVCEEFGFTPTLLTLLETTGLLPGD